MAEDELITLTATQAAGKIAGGSLSSEDYVRACLDRIGMLDREIHAFVHLDPDHALSQARDRDESRRNGRPVGPLHGIPVAIKDIFDTADYPTENGSPLFSGRRPVTDAGVVARLRAAGAVIIGKTVSTECAYFHPGPTRNPRDLERTPGGSSSGSAAAVAAGMVPLALGTQTNGSVIRPAAFCGVFGMKPSHGLVSRAGVLPLSASLDHVGSFARTLADIALIMDVIAGYDADDADTRPVAAPAHARILAETPPLPPRIAFVRTPIWDKADAQTREAFEEFAAGLGEAVQTVDLPAPFASAWNYHRAIMAAEMAHNLGEIVDRGGDKSSKTLRDLLAAGKQVKASEYLHAKAQARHIAFGLAEIFDHYDAILTPATKGVAPKGIGATGDPAFCSLWTLAGLPALSLPIMEDDGGLPLGVQLVGAVGDDARLLRTAHWLIGTLDAD